MNRRQITIEIDEAQWLALRTWEHGYRRPVIRALLNQAIAIHLKHRHRGIAAIIDEKIGVGFNQTDMEVEHGPNSSKA